MVPAEDIEGLTWPNLSSLEVTETGKEGSKAGARKPVIPGSFTSTPPDPASGIKSDLIILCFIPGESGWYPTAGFASVELGKTF